MTRQTLLFLSGLVNQQTISVAHPDWRVAAQQLMVAQDELTSTLNALDNVESPPADS